MKTFHKRRRKRDEKYTSIKEKGEERHQKYNWADLPKRHRETERERQRERQTERLREAQKEREREREGLRV